MKNLEKYFKRLKIKKNDYLLIHSSFKRLGSYGLNPPEYISKIEKYMSNGTLIFPSFTWQKTKKNLQFDYLKSKSEMGILSEVFRNSVIPWIDLDAAKTDVIVNQIKKCPSGALKYHLHQKDVA